MKKTLILWMSIAAILLPGIGFAAINRPTTLPQAERAALANAPELKALQAKSNAFNQSAVAANQFSDPELMLGAMNVPVDTFDFSQEPMTQIQIGLAQSFPKGRSLHYRSLQQRDLSKVEYEKKLAMHSQILRNVRNSWLELYYWTQTKDIVLAQKKVFKHLVKVTESLLANNKTQQKDVIRAQLELAELNNQLIDINQQLDTTRAQLARWVGPQLAKRSDPQKLPHWKRPPNLSQLTQIIQHHPNLRTEQALIAANHAGVQLAEQQYMPGFTVGVAYGIRQGRNINDSRRADFLTAQLNIDLPIFPRNRQNKTLKASEDNLVASQESRMSQYNELREALKTQYAIWQQQGKSATLYKRHLIPEAKQYAEATLTAYQNTQTDFPTLARAYVHELDIKLAGLKTTVNRDKARINLLYLQGK